METKGKTLGAGRNDGVLSSDGQNEMRSADVERESGEDGAS